MIEEAAALDARRGRRARHDRDHDGDRDEIFDALEHLARRIGETEREREAPSRGGRDDAGDVERTLRALLARSKGEDDRSRPTSAPQAPDPLAGAIANLERRLDEISSRIETRFDEGKTQSDPLLDGIRQRLDTLANRFDAPPAPPRLDPAQEARLARIEDALNGLSTSIQRHERGIETAREQDRVTWDREIAAATAANPELVAAVQEIAERQKALEANFDPDATVRALDDRLARYTDTLARHIDAAPRNAVADMQERIRGLLEEPTHVVRGEVGRLQAQVATLQDEISNAVSGTSLAAIVDEVRHLSVKLDEARRAGSAAEGLGRIEREMAAIREVVSTATPREALAEIDAKIGALGRRLDEFGAQTDPDTVKRISAQLGQVQRVVAEAMPLEAFKSLVQNIQSIESKLDRVASRPPDTTALEALRAEILGIRDTVSKPAPAFDELRDEIKGLRGAMARPQPALPAFDELRDEIKGLRGAMAAPKAPAIDPAVFDDFRGRMERLQHSVARQSGTESAIKALEAQLQSLGSRLDGVAKPQFPEALVDDIRAQIGEIAKRSPQLPFQAIERQIGDLAGKLDQMTRRGDDERALANLENHIKALSDRFGEVARQPNADPLVETLRDNLDALRATTQTSERRTAETLSAVHDTLIKVMERLDGLDRVVTAERVTRAAPEPHLPRTATIEPAAPRADARALADAPDPAPRDTAAKGVIAAARAAAQRAAEQLKAEAAPEPPKRREPPPMAPLAPGAADMPLEPGSGKPGAPFQMPKGAAPAAKAEPSPIDPVVAGENLRQSFIAAARRAAQAATAETDARGTKPAIAAKLEKIAGKPKAPVAERPLPGDAPEIDVDGKPGLVGRIVGTIKQRRKQVAMATGALLVLIMALQAVNMFTGGDDHANVAPPAPVMATQQAAPAPQRSEARVAPSAPVAETQRATPAAANPARPAAARAANLPEMPQGITSRRLREAVEAGEVRGVYEVGLRLFEGRGMQRDTAAAARWFRAAADMGHPPALYRLGNLLERGDANVRRDIPEAIRLYERAAQAGNRKAMHNLAALVAAANPPEYERAFRLFDQAANLGLVDSQYNLAVLHVNGLGTRQNLIEAYRWFAIAAQNGDQEAGRQRDQIGARLDGQALITTRTAAQGFRPSALDAAANEEIIPAQVWDDGGERTSSAAPPMVGGGGIPQRPGELGVQVGAQRRS